MTTLYDPTVIINNRRYYFKPNTFSYIGGQGVTTVTALSAGGGATDTAHSVDDATKVSHVKGTLDLKKTEAENVEALSALPKGTLFIKVTEADFSKSFKKMSLTNDPEHLFKADPELPVEFEGNPVL
jgi:hypothetical protein